MLYKGFWIDCVELSPAWDPDHGYDPLFIIRKRYHPEILAEARSISQALAVIRELIQDAARQGALNLGGVV
jgi:hypothetical protein